MKITWEDHTGWDRALTPKQLKKKDLTTIISVGWLVHRKKNIYFVSQEIHDDNQVRDTTAIDRRCVVKFEVLRK